MAHILILSWWSIMKRRLIKSSYWNTSNAKSSTWHSNYSNWRWPEMLLFLLRLLLLFSWDLFILSKFFLLLFLELSWVKDCWSYYLVIPLELLVLISFYLRLYASFLMG
jgi:hypothetical protein